MLLRMVFFLTLLFMLPILLIRAQPYDASTIRSVLMPQGCAPPCFMGLRPGETTLNEAVKFFEQRPNVHLAVQRPAIYNASDDWAVMYWREDGSPISGALNFESGQLVELTVQGLHLHEIWLALGEPDSGQMALEMIYLDNGSIISRPTAHMSFYTAYKIRVHTPSTCVAFWQQLTYVLIGQTVVPDTLSAGPTLSEQRQESCAQDRAYLRLIRAG